METFITPTIHKIKNNQIHCFFCKHPTKQPQTLKKILPQKFLNENLKQN